MFTDTLVSDVFATSFMICSKIITLELTGLGNSREMAVLTNVDTLTDLISRGRWDTPNKFRDSDKKQLLYTSSF